MYLTNTRKVSPLFDFGETMGISTDPCFSGHSLRKATAVTALNWCSRDEIKLLGPWKSDAVDGSPNLKIAYNSQPRQSNLDAFPSKSDASSGGLIDRHSRNLNRRWSLSVFFCC